MPCALMSTHTLDYVTAIADRIVEGAMVVFSRKIFLAATTTSSTGRFPSIRYQLTASRLPRQ